MIFKNAPKVLLFYFLIALGLSSPLYAKSQARTQETAIVTKVVDGDTLKVKFQGLEESIRLIGIDTPESKANKKAKKDAQRSRSDVETITAMGMEAAKFTASLVKPGDTVKIEFDVRPRDKYGRLLGYVYLINGKMLNDEIVKAGYANVMTIPPDVEYQERFLKAYRDARENKRGLWK